MTTARLPRYVRFLELCEIALALSLGCVFKIFHESFVVDWDLLLSPASELILSFRYWVSLGLLCVALHEALVWYPPTRDNRYLHGAVATFGSLGVAFAVAEAMTLLTTGIKRLT
jgi:hypothetical protein